MVLFHAIGSAEKVSKKNILTVAGPLLIVAAGACSDDTSAAGPAAKNTPDAAADATTPAVDAAGGGDSASQDSAPKLDASDAAVEFHPVALTIASGSHARLYNVAYAAGGIYATGQVTMPNSPTDFAIPLVKILPTGALDTAFGNGGLTTTNVSVGGAAGEIARGIGVQQDGKIVVAGVSEHGGPSDSTRDIVVLRFAMNGSLDETFGDHGIARVVLSSGEMVQQYGLTVLPNDDLIVTGARKAEERTTNEFAVLKLKANGAVDSSFGGAAGGDGGTAGVFNLGITTSISPRSASVLGNGSIIVTGYTNANGNKPLVFKLNANGSLDTSFGTNGVYFPETGIEGFGQGGSAEAYGAVLQGDKLVTTGYGKENSTQPAVGWISLRLNANGTRDMTYGTGGRFFLGVNDQGANSRGLALLPGNRILLLGGASPEKANADAGTQSQHAALAILTPEGALDPAFNPSGPRMFDLGGPSTGRGAHFFWGASVSPDQKSVAIVGIKGGITANPDAGISGGNDEAVFLHLPLGN